MISPTLIPIIKNPQSFELTSNVFSAFLTTFFGPLVVGIVLFVVGERRSEKKLKGEAIRDLMTLRGDYVSVDFRRALNKVSIVFHDNEDIRKEVRVLYETINNPALTQQSISRKIVGLIYKLCQMNGYEGLTEYDIDQAFPESKQEPRISNEPSLSPSASPSASPSPSPSPEIPKKTRKKSK